MTHRPSEVIHALLSSAHTAAFAFFFIYHFVLLKLAFAGLVFGSSSLFHCDFLILHCSDRLELQADEDDDDDGKLSLILSHKQNPSRWSDNSNKAVKNRDSKLTGRKDELKIAPEEEKGGK